MQDQQDQEDGRGRGGKAPRSKRGKGSSSQAAAAGAGAGAGGQQTPSRGLLGTTFSYLRSPLTAAAQVARGVGALLGTPAGHAAEPTSNEQEQPDLAPVTTAVPTAPPAQTIAPPVVRVITAPVVTQPAPVVMQAVVAAGQVAAAAAGTASTHAQPPTPTANTILQERQREGWSPSKLASLSHFLNNRKPQTAAQPAPPAAPQLSLVATSADIQRPYLGLKYLLQSGLPGAPVTTSWGASSQQGRAMPLPAPKPTLGGTGRYQPYTLAPPSRLRQTDGVGGPSSRPAGFELAAPPAPPTSPAPLALTPPHATTSHAVLGTPFAGTLGQPRSTAGAATATMATPGAATGTVGRQLALPRGPPVTPGGAAVASGQKRGRDTAEATKLMGSGIKNLAEYKRQRQRYTAQQQQQQSNRLSVLTNGTPKDRSRSNTASAVTSPSEPSQEATPMQQAAAITAGAPSAGQARTETARRILEALENMAKASDTPAATASKPLPNGTPKPNLLNQPGSTPWQQGQPPPLDRLTPLAATPMTETPAGFGLGEGTREGLPTPTTLFPKLVASTSTEAQPSTAAAAASSKPAEAGQPAQPTMPSYVSTSVIVAPAIDALAGLHPASRSRSVDRQTKSVRFAVPEEEGGPAAAAAPSSPKATSQAGRAVTTQPEGFMQPPAVAAHEAAERRAAAQKPAPALSARLEAAAATDGDRSASPLPVFTFGASQGDADVVVQTVGKVVKEVVTQNWQGADIPRFTFGTGAAAQQQQQPASQKAVAPTAPQPPVPAFDASQPDAALGAGVEPALKATLQQQVLEAAAVPLPEDEEDEPAADAQPAAAAVQPGAEAQAAPASEAQPASTAAAAAAPAASGWGDAFLQKSQAAFAAATSATAETIEKAKKPKPSASEAAATGGAFAFGAPASGTPAAAAPATATFRFGAPASTEGVKAATPTFTFGVQAASTPSATTTAPAAEAAATAEKAAEPTTEKTPAAPVATGGWGDAFLKSNQAALSSASQAVEQEIAKTSQGGAASAAAASTFQAPATAPSPASGFGATASAPAAVGGFNFGANLGAPPASPAPAAGSQEETTTTFGFMSPAPGFGAGSTGTGTGTTATMPFSFGAQPQQTAAAASSTQMFTFGAVPTPASTAAAAPSPQMASNNSTPADRSAPQAAWGFAASSTAAASSPATFGQQFTFGAAPTPQQAPPSSSSAFTFGATPAPAANAGGTPTNPFQLTPAPAAAPAAAPSAWASALAPSPTPSPAPSFAPASSGPFTFGAAAPSGPVFGSQQQQQQQQVSNPFTFGAAPSPVPNFGAGSGPASAFTFSAAAGMPATASPPPNTLGQPGSTPYASANFGGANVTPSPVQLGGGGAVLTPGPASFSGMGMPPTLGNAGNTSGFGAAGPTPIPFGLGQAAQPAFGTGTPATPETGGLGMSMNDFKPATSERRKLHARRTRH